MDGRPTWTDCDEAGDYVVPYVLSPRDLVSRPDIMDETVPHTLACFILSCQLWNHGHQNLAEISRNHFFQFLVEISTK